MGDDPNNLKTIINEVLSSEPFARQLQTTLQHVLQNTTTSSRSLNISPTTARPQTLTSPIEEVRRLFPSIAPIHSSSRSSSGQSKQRSRKRRHTEAFPEFKRDIILLQSPDTKLTLTGQTKSAAFEKGFGLCAVTFKKAWLEEDIYNHIQNLFTEKLKGTKFEILVPMSRSLVKPILGNGSSLDGSSICNIFFQKCIYIRPVSPLVDSISNTTVSVTELPKQTETPRDVINVLAEERNAWHEDPDQLSFNVENALERYPCSSNYENCENILVSTEGQFEADTMTAIRISEIKNIFDVLRELKSNINSDQLTEFNVYREEIFSCCVRAVRRKNFSPLNKISVTFTDFENCSEGAYDEGGPSREMFRLLFNFMRSSKMFVGPEYSKNLRLCNDALQKKEYFEVGRLIVLSLVHGGPGPNFFSESLFSILSYGLDSVQPQIKDIFDDTIREEIERMENCSTLEELQDVVKSSILMSVVGITYINNFEKKRDAIEGAIKFYTLHRIRPALDQLIDGLNTLNFLNRVSQFSSQLKSLFCYQEITITAEMLKSLFVPLLSEVGSNRRTVENRILAYWRDYIIDCEDGSTEINLEQILCFATGANGIPPLGFDIPPTLQFLHDDSSTYPKANTCSLVLSLPVEHNSYDNFKYHMDYAIQNGMVFGFA